MAENFDQESEFHQFHQKRVSFAVRIPGIRAKKLQKIHNSNKGKTEIRQVGIAKAEEINGEVMFLYNIKIKGFNQYRHPAALVFLCNFVRYRRVTETKWNLGCRWSWV